MRTLFHITTRDQVTQAEQQGVYVPAAFGSDGFIHCSYAEQVVWVANQRFRGRQDLVLLEIDAKRLSCKVVDENLEGGEELFPHIYGHLPTEAVVRIHEFPCDAQGRFELPKTVASAT